MITTRNLNAAEVYFFLVYYLIFLNIKIFFFYMSKARLKLQLMSEDILLNVYSGLNCLYNRKIKIEDYELQLKYILNSPLHAFPFWQIFIHSLMIQFDFQCLGCCPCLFEYLLWTCCRPSYLVVIQALLLCLEFVFFWHKSVRTSILVPKYVLC